MKEGICAKSFPKEFTEHTTSNEDSYPKYRRRSPNKGGQTATHKCPTEGGYKTFQIDNKWVVAYNSWLLFKYKTHINVEICSTVKSIKYMYKYIFKDVDRVVFSIANTYNKITKFLQGRYVSAPEACWRLFQFNLHSSKPNIIRLQVHIPDEQNVAFRENMNSEQIEELLESSEQV
jgi:hypothetical protein